MNEVKELVKAIASTPQARALLDAEKEPASIEEAVEVYADIAAKTGISVTKETIREFLEKSEKSQKAASAKAENAVKEALSEEKLEQVAGGQAENCRDTYTEGEWCMITDSCSMVIRFYEAAEEQEEEIVIPDNPDKNMSCNNMTYKVDFIDEGDGWESWKTTCLLGVTDPLCESDLVAP